MVCKKQWLSVVGLAAWLFAASFASYGWAQDEEKKPDAPATQPQPAGADSTEQASEDSEKKSRKTPPPWQYMPDQMGGLVTTKQREEVYGIQKRYYTQIKGLLDQVEALNAKRQGEIEGVLTPVQKEVLKILRKAAEEERKANQKKEQGKGELIDNLFGND